MADAEHVCHVVRSSRAALAGHRLLQLLSRVVLVNDGYLGDADAAFGSLIVARRVLSLAHRSCVVGPHEKRTLIFGDVSRSRVLVSGGRDPREYLGLYGETVVSLLQLLRPLDSAIKRNILTVARLTQKQGAPVSATTSRRL